jgi:hypothetical protein
MKATLLSGWLAMVADLEIVNTSNVIDEAQGNLLLFSLTEAQSAMVQVDDLNAFLSSAYQTLCRKAAACGFQGTRPIPRQSGCECSSAGPMHDSGAP